MIGTARDRQPDGEEVFPAPLDLGDPRLKFLVLRLAVPSVVGLSITGLHHVVNAFFIGMISTDAMAAVSTVFPLLIFVMAIGEGLGVGVAACLARYLGEATPAKASRAASLGLGLAVACGLIATTVLLACQHRLLILFGATPETIDMAVAYATIAALGSTLMLLQMVCDFVAIAEGNSRFSMWTLLISFGLNIGLDPLLIFVFDLGLAGAAWATILSQLVALALFALYFLRRMGTVHLELAFLRPDTAILRAIAAIGLPVALSTILTAATLAIVYHSASRYGGAQGVAGIGIALRLLTMAILPVAGFCLGAQPVLGYAVGAGDRPRLRAALRFMIGLAGSATCIYGALVLLLAPMIARLFSGEPAVQALATTAIRSYHLAFMLAGLQSVLTVFLQAKDRPVRAAIVSLAPQGYLLLPLLLLLPPYFGLNGIIAASTLASLLTSAAAAWMLRAELRALAAAPDSHDRAPTAPPPSPLVGAGNDYARLES